VIIARAADFYGSASPLSFMNVLVFEKIAKGKKPMLLVKANTRHSLTYIPDAGKATAMLGTTESAWNQVWHVPTAASPLTGRQMVEMASGIVGTRSNKKYTIMPRWMLQAAGIFVPVLRESVEMLYQNEYDYLFDSTKFHKAFDFHATSYRDGIAGTLKSYGWR
jgi:nucleoside-diphosphate-sugar epimerase